MVDESRCKLIHCSMEVASTILHPTHVEYRYLVDFKILRGLSADRVAIASAPLKATLSS
jgi:hypothetical protein